MSEARIKTTIYLDPVLKQQIQHEAIEKGVTISDLVNMYAKSYIKKTDFDESMKIAIKKLKLNAVLPSFATTHAAGMDIAACIDTPITLQPHERAVIPAGFAIALPAGYEAQVRGRSGLAAKHGIMPANGVGTIDADYRGEVGVILLNSSNEPFTVEPGMRIAQLVIAKYETVEWNEVEVLNKTSRGKGGYGSTGK